MAKKTTIYLVRHGDVYNPDGVFYERIAGFRLSDLGHLQAKTLGDFLAQKNISVIYASPLERAQETASYIQAHYPHLSVITDERLIEVSSVKRGQKQKDLTLERWNFYKPAYTKLGGEKLSDIWKRMNRFFRDIVKKHKGESIVAVSHGDPIMISSVKHRGRKLSIAAIRDAEYVETAKGFELVFEEFGATEVNKLQF